MSSVTPAAAGIKFAEGTSIPFIWGAQDAACGMSCVPENVWVRFADQQEYAAGWASVRGESDTTRWFAKGGKS